MSRPSIQCRRGGYRQRTGEFLRTVASLHIHKGNDRETRPGSNSGNGLLRRILGCFVRCPILFPQELCIAHLPFATAEHAMIDLSELTSALGNGQRLRLFLAVKIDAKGLLQRLAIASFGLRHPVPVLAHPIARDPGMTTCIGRAHLLAYVTAESWRMPQQLLVPESRGLFQRRRFAAVLQEREFFLDTLGAVAIKRDAPGPGSVVMSDGSDRIHLEVPWIEATGELLLSLRAVWYGKPDQLYVTSRRKALEEGRTCKDRSFDTVGRQLLSVIFRKGHYRRNAGIDHPCGSSRSLCRCHGTEPSPVT